VLRLRRLLCPHLLDLRPDARQLDFACLVHVQIIGQAERRQGDLDAANLLRFLADRPPIDVVHQLVRFALCGAAGLHQF
jgi:hypothetical protein